MALQEKSIDLKKNRVELQKELVVVFLLGCVVDGQFFGLLAPSSFPAQKHNRAPRIECVARKAGLIPQNSYGLVWDAWEALGQRQAPAVWGLGLRRFFKGSMLNLMLNLTNQGKRAWF